MGDWSTKGDVTAADLLGAWSAAAAPSRLLNLPDYDGAPLVHCATCVCHTTPVPER